MPFAYTKEIGIVERLIMLNNGAFFGISTFAKNIAKRHAID